VWSGIELLCLPLLTLGGVGFVSAVTNLAPSAVASMYDLFVGGDTDKALDIHYGLHPLVDLMFVETNPAPIKDVLSRAGLIDSGHVRAPLVTPRPASRDRIDALLVEGAPMLDGPLADLAATLVDG
jgi:4-hydroxy-tetrahydrodipicolinate synthase